MTTEQKEAIETMQHWIEYAKQNKDKINKVDELIGIQETVLNLIQEQEKEIEASRQITTEMNNDVKKLIIECKKKNKIINLMAKKLNQAYFDEDKFCIWFEKMMGVQQKMDYGYVVDLIKQYFERKVEDEKI